MARRKPFDPYAVGYFVEVRLVNNRAGYEWMVVLDEYNTYIVESIPMVATATGMAYNHRSAYETGFRVQDVFVAIDNGNIESIDDSELTLVSKLQCVKARYYIVACLNEMSRRATNVSRVSDGLIW